ncbi:hypothetical protein Adt_24273 [Abeliophyllum distichum]|uniref:Zinc knuckle CX2CX4HX4C domain-containing protein n=1 Tax=Abeliophyllum distichum TaxID=126358 RepID=A0ABD1SD99_9LAMI
MDINAPRLDRIRIGNEDFAIWQNIYYEDLPLYCSFCKHLGGHEVERCLWKKTTGSKNNTSMEGEGFKTFQVKKKGKAVWVERQSGEISNDLEQGEIRECSKGNNDIVEETRKHDMKTQTVYRKEDDGNIHLMENLRRKLRVQRSLS